MESLDPHALAQLKQTYHSDGVTRVVGLLNLQEVDEIREHIVRYAREKMPSLPPADYVLEKDGHTPRNLWRLEAHDDFFRQLGARKDFLALVEPLVGASAILVGVETFNKPARVGSGVPPHQDNAYFCQIPPDMLTLWIAIDPATAANGAVQYLKGSHQTMLPHQPSHVQGNSIGLAQPPRMDEASLFTGLLKPGDALLHHCQTIHFSGPNLTDTPRCGLLLVYRGPHTRTDPALKAAYDQARSALPKA